VNHDELDSQLSAMFDGELPAAECELLSRRIDRDENLRACWSRYALIGAAMRSEPVATARSGFAARVSAALAARVAPRVQRHRNWLWSAALAACLVAGVAGVSVNMLRDAALRQGAGAPVAAAPRAASDVAQVRAETPPRVEAAVRSVEVRPFGGVPSYVTPAGRGSGNTLLRTELADYIVAHSAYSTPLVRRNLLSELVTSEDGLNIAPGVPGAAGPTQGSLAGSADAINPVSAPGR
jgi:sigma-E factor negative regulatory protein RseA